MPYVSPNVQDEPEKSQYILGFPRGLNTIQDKTLVNDKNLTQADNVMTVVDGLTRRYGSTKVYDEASATKIYGAGAFYKKRREDEDKNIGSCVLVFFGSCVPGVCRRI